MNKIVFMFVFVESIVVLGFQLFGLNVLWSFAEGGDGILGLAVIIGTTSVFRAVSSLLRGYIVDSFQKKTIILISLSICGFLCIVWLFAAHFLIIAIIAYIAITLTGEIYSSSYAALVAEKLSSNDYIKYDSISIMAGRIIAVLGNLMSAVLIIFLSTEVIALVVAITLMFGALTCQRFLPKSKIESKTEKVKMTWSFAKENVFGNKKVLIFIVIVFLLNLDYAFIPTLLPLYIITVTELTSPLLFGVIRTGNNIGEFAASAIILKHSRLVSRLTKIGLGGSAIVFMLLPFVYAIPVAVVLFFIIYSFFDMLTQPLYSYFVSSLESQKRGRILGIVDSIILLASPFGILLGGLLSSLGMFAVSIGIMAIFTASLIVIVKSKIYSSIILDK